MLGTDKGPVRAAIYCRMSVAELGDVEKVERQEEDCRALCERLGWDPARVFVDNSKSAWRRNRKRPDWDLMLEGVQDNQFDAIVIYHGDRLIRQPWDLELLLNLASEKGMKLASPTGTRNLDSADDRFILRIEAAQACRESDNISRRVRRAKEARRQAGVAALGRTRAFGRNADGSIREEEAALIRDVFARLIAGETQSGLWHEWTKRGVPTVRGGQWWYTTFRQMLRRHDLAGLVAYKGQTVGAATNLEPIVDREVWEAVQLLMNQTSEQYPDVPAPRRHLLSGWAVCSGCDRPVGIGSKSAVRRYRCQCPTCPRPTSRNMAQVDEYVIAFVLERLSDPRLWEGLERAREAEVAGDENLGSELGALEARRAMVLMQLAEDDSVSPAELAGVLRRLDERIGGVRSRIGSQRSTGVLEGLRGLDRSGWDELPLDRRRSVVRRLCAVRLLPSPRGPRFREEFVEILDAEDGGTPSAAVVKLV